MWCPTCRERVESSGATCLECGDSLLTESHPSVCRERRPLKKERAPSTNGLVRVCARCKKERLHGDRGGGRPRPYCKPCMRVYFKEWREKNWQRRKVRDTWKGMINRCLKTGHGRNCPPGIPRYADYGAKGIGVCRRWQGKSGFANFVADLGLPPSRTHTLDRIRPKNNYSPSNCRWVTKEVQDSNRKNTCWITAWCRITEQEQTRTMSEWARVTGLRRRTIGKRLSRGWDWNRAVSVWARGARWPYEDQGVPF